MEEIYQLAQRNRLVSSEKHSDIVSISVEINEL